MTEDSGSIAPESVNKPSLMHYSSTSYGVVHSLLKLGFVGIGNVVQLLGRTLASHQLLVAHCKSDGKVNGSFTLYGSDFIDSIQFKTSKSNHGGIESNEDRIDGIHPTFAAKSDEIGSILWVHRQQWQVVLIVNYKSLMKWQYAYLGRSRVPAASQVGRGGGDAMLLCAVRQFDDMKVVTAWCLVTETVSSVDRKERREYLWSFFGQPRNICVCYVNIGHRHRSG